MELNKKYLEERLKAYCGRCGISRESKEAWHYEMGLKHGLDKTTRNLILTKKEKPHIKVFITKTNEFRAIIKENSKTPSYEVTVGGKSWIEGKGAEHEKEIKEKCQELILSLKNKLNYYI